MFFLFLWIWCDFLLFFLFFLLFLRFFSCEWLFFTIWSTFFMPF
ncbi:transporter [Erwinia psidii]|nr:transporter [Erwinia psidii]